MKKTLGLYALTGLFCYVALHAVLHLGRADWSVPFQDRGDAMSSHLLIKTNIDKGWYLNNDLLGAPYGMHFQDFPMSDSLQFGIMKLIALGTSDAGQVANIYFSLTFLFAAWTALYALRGLGIRTAPAVLASVSFAFSTYHFWRGQGHFFLSGYYMVPPMVLVALWTYLGRLSFQNPDPDPTVGPPALSRRSLWLRAIPICLLGSSTGVYYAFFACYLFVAVGVLASVRFGSIRPFLHTLVLVTVVGGGVVANLIPTYVFVRENGPNPSIASRYAAEADIYPVKFSQLILPRAGHRVPALASIKLAYNSIPHAPVPGDFGSSLGLLGLVGFVAILMRALANSRLPTRRDSLAGALGVLCIAALLLACVGGIGSLFNFSITPMIRCYDRMSIFILFFSLAGLAAAFESVLRRLERSRLKAIAFTAFLALLVPFGIWEQTTTSDVPPWEATQSAFYSDRAFVEGLETTLEPGSMVFQLPFLNFPESGSVHNCHAYDHFRLYMHTKALRWSHGASYGRYSGMRLGEVGKKPIRGLIPDAIRLGYSAICIDRNGYVDRAAGIEKDLAEILGVAPLSSPDGRYCSYSLLAYSETYRKKYTAAEWESLGTVWRHKPSITGFSKAFRGEETGPNRRWQWATLPHAEVTLFNPADHPQQVTFRFAVLCYAAGENSLRMVAGEFDETITLSQVERVVTRTFEIGPGVTDVAFDYGGAVSPDFKGDPTKVLFSLANYELLFP